LLCTVLQHLLKVTVNSELNATGSLDLRLVDVLTSTKMPPPALPGNSGRDNRSELLGPSTAQANRSGINNPTYLSSPTHGSTQAPSEMEQIHLQINKTTDESLDSTRRMVGLLDESHAVGAKTMENLYRQGTY
jgi:hypothetical protein